MSDANKPRKALTRETDPGFFRGLTDQFRLVLRLMGDKRVPFWLKLLPAGTLVYFVFPDLAPGPIDDAVIIGLGAYVFVEMCPPHVVEEHRAALRGEAAASGDGEIVDADFKQD
ncbi:MAG: hypothetical protein HYZ26_00815 [Chloroflexi bacterium]|nr:hypothetical protein [Chloroflexota bacterium]